MQIDLKRLAEFLVKAKKSTYASVDSMNIKPERSGFKELEFCADGLYYRDSYCGFYSAPGMEVVRLENKEGKPVWTMSYSGGMSKEYHGEKQFTLSVFSFLKKVLENVQSDKPFRGPGMKEGDFEYSSKINGDISEFSGEEKIIYKGKVVFRQFFSGGFVVEK